MSCLIVIFIKGKCGLDISDNYFKCAELFWNAPDNALFTEEVVVHALNLDSEFYNENADDPRVWMIWPDCLDVGVDHTVKMYRKSDILQWLKAKSSEGGISNLFSTNVARKLFNGFRFDAPLLSSYLSERLREGDIRISCIDVSGNIVYFQVQDHVWGNMHDIDDEPSEKIKESVNKVISQNRLLLGKAFNPVVDIIFDIVRRTGTFRGPI